MNVMHLAFERWKLAATLWAAHALAPYLPPLVPDGIILNLEEVNYTPPSGAFALNLSEGG